MNLLLTHLTKSIRDSSLILETILVGISVSTAFVKSGSRKLIQSSGFTCSSLLIDISLFKGESLPQNL
jgi:hypothetical protein